jgi:hypothetical protein
MLELKVVIVTPSWHPFVTFVVRVYLKGYEIELPHLLTFYPLYYVFVKVLNQTVT